MPSAQRVHWAQLRVGILATAALIIAAVLIFLLTGPTSIFEKDVLVRTFMEDSAGMTENATVRLNGILVGHIQQVVLSGSKDPNRTVEIDMMIPESYLDRIPEDSKAAIAAANLLGDKYINITRGTHSKHIEAGGEIGALQTQDVPQILAQSSNLLSQFQTIMGRIDGLLTYVESGKGNVGLLLKDDTLYTRLTSTAGEVEQLVKDVKNSNGTISHLLYDDTLYNDIRKPIQRLDDILAEVQQKRGTAGKLLYDPAVYDEARALIAQARQLAENLNAGKGTAGKLLTDDQVYQQLDLIAQKVNLAMDKLNAGQGTLGQLMVNPQLYDSINDTSREVNSFLKDVHANPKKFLRIKFAIF